MSSDYYATYVKYAGDVFEVRIWPNEHPDPIYDPYRWHLYPYLTVLAPMNPEDIRERNYQRLGRALKEAHPEQKLGYGTLAEAKEAVRRAIKRLGHLGKRWGVEWDTKWYRMGA